MITTAITADLIHGAVEIEPAPDGLRPHRLPRWAREQAADPLLTTAASQTAGVRLAVTTTAQRLELLGHLPQFPAEGSASWPMNLFDVVVDGRLHSQAQAEATPGGHVVSVAALPSGDKRVEVWLPTGAAFSLREIRADRPVAAAQRQGRRWVHYGSSISQGTATTHPTGSWVARSALAAGLDLTNLGLAGACQVDQFVARTMGSLPADLLSVELGINVVNFDSMRRRVFRSAVHGFLDTLREAHPDVPLLVISPFACAIHEDTPGPCALTAAHLAGGPPTYRALGDPAEASSADRLTLGAVRKELRRIVNLRAATDPRLAYLDGLELFGTQDEARLPYLDHLHPGQEAHNLISERFGQRLAAFAALRP